MKALLTSMISIVVLLFSSLPSDAVYHDKAKFVPGQILVKFRADTPQAIIKGIMEKQKVSIKKQIKGIDVHLLRIPANISVEDMVNRFNSEVSVEYAEPDYIAEITQAVTPNDNSFEKQWNLNNIGQTGGRDDALAPP